jgi:hypothetical protein
MTRADIRELLRLGYIEPRSKAARALVQQQRETTALLRRSLSDLTSA